MSKSSDRDGWEQYSRFADALIEAASKEDLARCARLLALGLARYRAAYGDLPEVESLLFRGSETSARALADGMKNLVSTLASVARSPGGRSAV